MKGLRFRKRVRLLPGVHANISKSGLSTSFGVPGATVNRGKRGTMMTVGLPGSGLSYSRFLSRRGALATAKKSDVSPKLGLIVASLVGIATVVATILVLN